MKKFSFSGLMLVLFVGLATASYAWTVYGPPQPEPPLSSDELLSSDKTLLAANNTLLIVNEVPAISYDGVFAFVSPSRLYAFGAQDEYKKIAISFSLLTSLNAHDRLTVTNFMKMGLERNIELYVYGLDVPRNVFADYLGIKTGAMSRNLDHYCTPIMGLYKKGEHYTHFAVNAFQVLSLKTIIELISKEKAGKEKIAE